MQPRTVHRRRPGTWPSPSPPAPPRRRPLDRERELALVQAARPAVEVGVAEVVLLHEGDQACSPAVGIEVVELDGAQPCAQQAAGVLGGSVASRRPRRRAGVGVAQQALTIAITRAGPGARVRAGDAAPERASGQRDRGVRPLRCAALGAARDHLARAHVREELRGRARRRGFGVGAADVDARVVVAAADADAVARGDVRRRGPVQLASARAVARLPDREQLGQPAAMAGASAGRRPCSRGARARTRSRALTCTRRKPRRRRGGPAAIRGPRT